MTKYEYTADMCDTTRLLSVAHDILGNNCLSDFYKACNSVFFERLEKMTLAEGSEPVKSFKVERLRDLKNFLSRTVEEVKERSAENDRKKSYLLRLA